MSFIKEQSEASPPFFMMVATPACHAPFTPAPQYKENFNSSKAPRTPSFNTAGGPVSVIRLTLSLPRVLSSKLRENLKYHFAELSQFKQTAPLESTAQWLLFEWSQTRVSSTKDAMSTFIY